MRDYKEEYIKYERQRDVLFVFGAGASIADGAPSQKDILPIILDGRDDEISNSQLGREVKKFIDSNFFISSDSYPSLEAVFGYMDYFINAKEGLGGSLTTEKIYEIRSSLVKLIHYVIGKSRKESKGIYRKFWESVKVYSRNISVITMNYDTLLDEAFDFLYPDYGYIDYCIPLMNYDHYPDIDPFNWWVNPREPVPKWEGGDPKPIKIIKIHGSLNWKYCNCCNQVLLTPWDTEIDLNSKGFLRYEYASCENPETRSYEYICPLDNTKFITLIVPPSHIKELNNPIINRLMDESAREIRVSKKIVFVGYSFPEADVHIKALFKKNIKHSIHIVVINPFLNETVKANYCAITDHIEFVDSSFEEILDDSEKIKTLLF
jgi:NAD-dependent SIR2 family protein deacetylase